ncbi:anthranilate synthase component I [Paenisporosarcina quisquiliarum]|uniref:Anthranilate synthase component 1 n=1 Tax=Paenisporosarcina quisquiliarum TaxID=365346 RepID=A0A9X3LI26_9BACL|nr:anthranilate synthase component I [Paenisporosarcina quisquiliarum]MCZ8537745.1 anthranilate synthase component I [Paenisporosarcina quisquiliarum]
MQTHAVKTTRLTINGDTLSPIAIFKRLQGTRKFLLESSLKHEASGRYSFIGADPVRELRGSANELIERSLLTGEITVHSGKPIESLKTLLPFDDDNLEFPFTGGAVGYIGYDVIAHYEDIGPALPDERDMPDIHLLIYETVVVYDHQKQDVTILHNGATPSPIEEIERQLTMKELEVEESEQSCLPFTSNVTKQSFIDQIERAKECIRAGEVFQIVLSQRLQATYTGDPLTLYRKLRKDNPSPYMFYVDFDEHVVLGASPESLLSIQGNRVTTNPIAGTRRRGQTPEEDAQLAKELLADPKELAEHRMLVDLGRNDLGRISEVGSIHLTKYMNIEKYQHVMHIVSEVAGTLRNDQHPLDALVACLPAGTVTGAPKIRAMQIIQDMENVKRGVYAGAVGYIGFNGNIDIALAIRTLVIKDQTAYVQAGAGIVYDSDPQEEFEETLHKAKSLLEVLA